LVNKAGTAKPGILIKISTLIKKITKLITMGMKKKLFLVLCILGAIFKSEAQVHFGVKAGYNLSDIYLSGANVTSEVKSKSGFNAGVFSTIQLSKLFSLQPEVFYSEQGAQRKDSSANLNYNYLNVPVLLKYQLYSGIFIETGPQIGFLLNSTYKSNTYSEDLNFISKSMAFSWAFGAGYKFPSINFGFDIRYNIGISNIQTYSWKTRNSVLQIDLFYLFKQVDERMTQYREFS